VVDLVTEWRFGVVFCARLPGKMASIRFRCTT